MRYLTVKLNRTTVHAVAPCLMVLNARLALIISFVINADDKMDLAFL